MRVVKSYITGSGTYETVSAMLLKLQNDLRFADWKRIAIDTGKKLSQSHKSIVASKLM
jgi:hypothetical protein